MCLPSGTGGFQVAPLRWIIPNSIPFLQPFFRLAWHCAWRFWSAIPSILVITPQGRGSCLRMVRTAPSQWLTQAARIPGGWAGLAQVWLTPKLALAPLWLGLLAIENAPLVFSPAGDGVHLHRWAMYKHTMYSYSHRVNRKRSPQQDSRASQASSGQPSCTLTPTCVGQPWLVLLY